LLITYIELRILEIGVKKQRLKLQGIKEDIARETRMDFGHLVQCDVDRFYGD